jgi:hypothetical protein
MVKSTGVIATPTCPLTVEVEGVILSGAGDGGVDKSEKT